MLHLKDFDMKHIVGKRGEAVSVPMEHLEGGGATRYVRKRILPPFVVLRPRLYLR